MRNWNLINICLDLKDFKIASLPMRNWNLEIKSCSPNAFRDCQPTYEELKLFINSRTCLISSNCQPTYEELKRKLRLDSPQPLSIASLPMRNWNFCGKLSLPSANGHCQPTYEELKQGLGFWSWQEFNPLPAYLWGIETVLSKPELFFFIQLPAYLWGIETKVTLIVIAWEP